MKYVSLLVLLFLQIPHAGAMQRSPLFISRMLRNNITSSPYPSKKYAVRNYIHSQEFSCNEINSLQIQQCIRSFMTDEWSTIDRLMSDLNKSDILSRSSYSFSDCQNMLLENALIYERYDIFNEFFNKDSTNINAWIIKCAALDHAYLHKELSCQWIKNIQEIPLKKKASILYNTRTGDYYLVPKRTVFFPVRSAVHDENILLWQNTLEKYSLITLFLNTYLSPNLEQELREIGIPIITKKQKKSFEAYRISKIKNIYRNIADWFNYPSTTESQKELIATCAALFQHKIILDAIQVKNEPASKIEF